MAEMDFGHDSAMLKAILRIVRQGGRKAVTALLFLAVLWTSATPTTGSPCVEWRWRMADPSGWTQEVLTQVNHVEMAVPLATVRVDCQCFDAQGRPSPWSTADVYYPPQLLAWWYRAGMVVGRAPGTMTVGFIRSTEWSAP